MASGTVNPSTLGNMHQPMGAFGKECDTSQLIHDFLDRERDSNSYRYNLEVRIANECARLQEERNSRNQLQLQLVDLQWSQVRLDHAYHLALEDNQELQQALALEKKRSTDFEARLSTALSLQSALQSSTLDEGTIPSKSVSTYQLMLRNQTQEALITELRRLNESYAETIYTLQSTLQDTLGNFSCPSYSDSDGSSTVTASPIVGQVSGNGKGASSKDSAMDNEAATSLVDIKQGGTWYEE